MEYGEMEILAVLVILANTLFFYLSTLFRIDDDKPKSQFKSNKRGKSLTSKSVYVIHCI